MLNDIVYWMFYWDWHFLPLEGNIAEEITVILWTSGSTVLRADFCMLYMIKTKQKNNSKQQIQVKVWNIFVLLQGLTSGVKWPSGSPTGRVLSHRPARISPVRTAFAQRPLPCHPSASISSRCPAQPLCQSPRCPPSVPVRRRSATAAQVRTLQYYKPSADWSWRLTFKY